MPRPTGTARLRAVPRTVIGALYRRAVARLASRGLGEDSKPHEIAVAEDFLASGWNDDKPFGPRWGAEYWRKWAVVVTALEAAGVAPGAEILDLGCGPGWTTLFLAESGYRPLGVDVAPASLEVARRRAERWGVPAAFATADMERLDLGRRFDAVLVFDALHHTDRRAEVVRGVAEALRPGGVVIFGEPSWLHYVSPGALRARRDHGWIENGVFASGLKRDCRAAGLGAFRRLFEGTLPYERRGRGFLREVALLAAANAWVAPHASIWLLARKPGDLMPDPRAA